MKRWSVVLVGLGALGASIAIWLYVWLSFVPHIAAVFAEFPPLAGQEQRDFLEKLLRIGFSLGAGVTSLLILPICILWVARAKYRQARTGGSVDGHCNQSRKADDGPDVI